MNKKHRQRARQSCLDVTGREDVLAASDWLKGWNKADLFSRNISGSLSFPVSVCWGARRKKFSQPLDAGDDSRKLTAAGVTSPHNFFFFFSLPWFSANMEMSNPATVIKSSATQASTLAALVEAQLPVAFSISSEMARNGPGSKWSFFSKQQLYSSTMSSSLLLPII